GDPARRAHLLRHHAGRRRATRECERLRPHGVPRLQVAVLAARRELPHRRAARRRRTAAHPGRLVRGRGCLAELLRRRHHPRPRRAALRRLARLAGVGGRRAVDRHVRRARHRRDLAARRRARRTALPRAGTPAAAPGDRVVARPRRHAARTPHAARHPHLRARRTRPRLLPPLEHRRRRRRDRARRALRPPAPYTASMTGRGTQLALVLLAIAGLAIVVTSLVASGGRLLEEITVRGGTMPALLVTLIGALLGGGAIAGLLWVRRG